MFFISSSVIVLGFFKGVGGGIVLHKSINFSLRNRHSFSSIFYVLISN